VNAPDGECPGGEAGPRFPLGPRRGRQPAKGRREDAGSAGGYPVAERPTPTNSRPDHAGTAGEYPAADGPTPTNSRPDHAGTAGEYPAADGPTGARSAAPADGSAPSVGFAAVGVHQLVLDGIAAWSAAVPDLDLVAEAATVGQLLARLPAAASVVVLGLADRPGRDGEALLGDVLLLKGYGLGVVLLSARPGGGRIEAALEAAADGVLTLDQGLDILACLLRRIAPAAALAWASASPSALLSSAPAATAPCVPSLSEQERAVLLGYASGMTLSTVARQIGIRPSTAKEYLHRVKIKYREVGRPTYTKIDLANRVREDGFAVEVAH
jgi:DNA-binding NarL/FixJ family response regulator